MKTFNELKIGDKIYDVEHGSYNVSIYQIYKITKEHCNNKRFYLHTIIGNNIGCLEIGYGLGLTNYESTRGTTVFANENDFLEFIKRNG